MKIIEQQIKLYISQISHSYFAFSQKLIYIHFVSRLEVQGLHVQK